MTITATSAIHTLWIWKKWVATVHDCLWASLGSQESRSKNKSGSIQAVNSLGQPNQHATRNSTITHQNAGRSTGRSTWIAALIFVKSLRMSKNQILGFRGAITPIITGSYISWWWFVSNQPVTPAAPLGSLWWNFPQFRARLQGLTAMGAESNWGKRWSKVDSQMLKRYIYILYYIYRKLQTFVVQYFIVLHQKIKADHIHH